VYDSAEGDEGLVTAAGVEGGASLEQRGCEVLGEQALWVTLDTPGAAQCSAAPS
jgi:hypothetical protein